METRRILLARRPEGAPTDADFQLGTGETRAPRDGEVLVENLYLSIDPAIRGWMREGDSYMEPIALGEAVRSGTLCRVLESKHDAWQPGDCAAALTAWEDYSVVRAELLGRKLAEDSGLPLSNQLSVLGGTGLTAYFGLLELGRPEPGQTVVVTAAAGGVGSIVGQLAKLHGCRAIGICGSDGKCAWLTGELGFDGAINYRREDVAARLKALCPTGIHVAFDNVGGELLDLMLLRIARGARVVLCGAISQINTSELPPGPKNYIRLLTKRASMHGFVTMDFAARWAEASSVLAEHVRAGKLKHREHVFEGLESAPRALGSLFDGTSRGKVLVRLRD